MSELFVELFSEEMPPNLQINARNQFKKLFTERKNFYALADYKINCNHLTKNDIINKIISIYEKQ